jgi:uncharacterized hydrophobic protein (TIGR00271 family)
MSIAGKSAESNSDVRFTRVLRLSTISASAASITAGLGVFVLLQPVLSRTGQHAPLVYLSALLVFAPIILTYAERSASIPGSGGVYNLARASESVWLTYQAGWVLLGGYVCLIALLSWSIARQLILGLQVILAVDIDIRWVALGVLLVGAVSRWWRSQENWQRRTFIVFGGMAALGVILIGGWWALQTVEAPALLAAEASAVSNAEVVANIFQVVPFLSLGLWGLAIVLDHREKVRRPSDNMLRALSAPILTGNLFGAATAMVLLGYPFLASNDPAALTEQIGTYPSSLTMLYLLITCSVLLIALNETLTGGVRVVGEMTSDGFIPKFFERKLAQASIPFFSIAGLTLMAAAILWWFPFETFASAAALAFLLVTALLHAPDIFRRAPSMPNQRRLKLPLHPLFPTLTVVISLVMSASAARINWSLMAAWIGIGLIYYLLYARQGTIAIRQQMYLAGQTAKAERQRYRVMVYLDELERDLPLIDIGEQIARARQGQLQVLQVDNSLDRSAIQERKASADARWRRLESAVIGRANSEVPIRPLVRIAPTVIDGIRETVWEEHVDLVVVGWSAANNPVESKQDHLNRLLRQISAEVVIVDGTPRETYERLVVPTEQDDNSRAALGLAQLIAADSSGQAALIQLDEITASASTSAADLLVLGASAENILGQSTLSGLPGEMLSQRAGPTWIVKRAENQQTFRFRQLWHSISSFLPNLSGARRAELTSQMKTDAVANVDFFVLITLAAAIAYLGLVLNSGAVIIGAMLVAPLMSPIMAIAHHIVLGDLATIQKAAESTFRGILMAIGVAWVLTLALPGIMPTQEILGRTEPQLLDLLVALVSGAAGAYAMSRKEVSAALPGVAIAAALVPPLCVTGYGLGAARLDIAAGALLLFITNLAAIVFAGALIFLLVGFEPRRGEAAQRVRKSFWIAIISLLIVAIPLGFATYNSYIAARDVNTVEGILRNQLEPDRAEIEDLEISYPGDGILVSFTLYLYEQESESPDLTFIHQELEDATSASVRLKVRMIPATTAIFDE